MQLFINGSQTTLSDFMKDDLPRAVINSLFSWKRAEDDDELPGTSREGWWADSFNDDGDRFGSRLWLLSRSKITDETLLRAEEYAQEALQWLIDDGVAVSIDVKAERGEKEQLDLVITISQPEQKDLTARFADVWSSL
nr:MAG TPA: hypothetical protein [Caudoviricetes sp.]